MHSKGPTDLWNIVRRPGRASTSVTCCSDQSAGAAGYDISKCVTLAWKCSAILGYRPGWVNMSRYTSGHDARSGDIRSIVRHLSSIVLRLISCLMKSESSPQNSTPQTHVRKNTSSPMSAPSRESTATHMCPSCLSVLHQRLRSSRVSSPRASRTAGTVGSRAGCWRAQEPRPWRWPNLRRHWRPRPFR